MKYTRAEVMRFEWLLAEGARAHSQLMFTAKADYAALFGRPSNGPEKTPIRTHYY